MYNKETMRNFLSTFFPFLKKKADQLIEIPDDVPQASWEDPCVQVIYQVLADTTHLPPEGQHWEGFVARRAVGVLRDQGRLNDSVYLRAVQSDLAKAIRERAFWEPYIPELNKVSSAENTISLLGFMVGGADGYKERMEQRQKLLEEIRDRLVTVSNELGNFFIETQQPNSQGAVDELIATIAQDLAKPANNTIIS